jgi:hypothetical protein
VREWRDFKSFVHGAMWVGGALLAIPAILLSLSALGWIHLR